MNVLSFNVIPRKSPRDKSVKYYAQPITAGKITTEDLAKEIAGRCSLTYGDMLNVFRNLAEVIPKYLSAGFHINIRDLGILFLSLSSRGTETKDKFTAYNIRRVGFHIYFSSSFKNNVLQELRFEKQKEKNTDPGD